MWLIVSSLALSTFNLLESVFAFTFAEGRAILTETTRCSSSAAKCAGAPGRHADAAKHLVETAFCRRWTDDQDGPIAAAMAHAVS
jgi:hypothetical protein